MLFVQIIESAFSGFLLLGHYPLFRFIIKTVFQKLVLLLSAGKREGPILIGPLDIGSLSN
jgi:hypothetical protein